MSSGPASSIWYIGIYIYLVYWDIYIGIYIYWDIYIFGILGYIYWDIYGLTNSLKLVVNLFEDKSMFVHC